MRQNLCAVLFFSLYSINLGNALWACIFEFLVKCYFQRCQDTPKNGWVCNYHGAGVQVECEADEVCFEETNRGPWESNEGPIIIERNCRTTFIYDGELIKIRDWYKREFHVELEDDNMFISEIPDVHIAGGTADLCNNRLRMPPLFEIAENIRCYRQVVYKECGADVPGCFLMYTHPLPGLEVTCGSELDWACYSERSFYNLELVLLHRDCLDLDSLDLTVRDQLNTNGSSLILRPTIPPHKWDIFYCSTTFCNDYW